MSKFFSTPINSDTCAIVDELLSKGFTELEQSGQGNLFIDTVNKTYWQCGPENLEVNRKFVGNMNETVEQINLNQIKSWQI